MNSREMVERGTILRATVGSTLHGLHHGGQDDRDQMAVFVEPPAYLLGLARAPETRGGLYGFEHYVERTQPEGLRSGPGDLDLVAYSLRKYVRLALKGHPTILLLLFAPDEFVLTKTALGDKLRALRPALLSRRAGRGYLGYLRGQKERLLGTRGQKRVRRSTRSSEGWPRRWSERRFRPSPTALRSTASSSRATGGPGAGSRRRAAAEQPRRRRYRGSLLCE